jgi:SAM-dependent methyltransferase
MTGLTNRRGGRGGLVTTLMSKMEADRELEQMDRTVWYTVDRTDMAPEVAAKFRQLGEDEETAAFIRHSFEQSDWLFTQLYYNLAKSLLGWFYCQTDINGILGRGSMFVFSREQILQLTGFPSSPDSCLLDLGAGDGRPTAALAGFFQRTFVTEMSGPMRRLCAARGFTVLELDAWAREPAVYDVISALNLFDRCDKPLSILKDVHYSLKPGGLLVVALVLPFRPYVESVPSHKPSEAMIVSKGTFKHEVETAVAAFAAAGFTLERWSRVPDLCEGDLRKPIYQLDNGLFVFRRTEGGGEEQNAEQQMEN